jgi:hypothetical protein
MKQILPDESINNVSAGHWVDSKQVTAAHTRLFKASFFNLSGGDLYVWIFNVAAGASSSAAPVHVRLVPSGYSDTWDLGATGKLFNNGVYVVVSSAKPTDPTTTPAATLAGNDAMIMEFDVRQM